MQYQNDRTLRAALYLLTVHLTAMLFFSVFRVILYLSNIDQTAGIEGSTVLFFRAMLRGFQFDNLTASYVTALPLLLLCIMVPGGRFSRSGVRCLNIYYMIIYSLIFGIAIIDIRYFTYFLAHIKTDAFGWFQFASMTTGMVFQETGNYPFFALAILSIATFWAVIRKTGRLLFAAGSNPEAGFRWRVYIPVAVVLLAVCLTGIRGTLKIYPLRTGNAFFSSYSLYNQLGINPVFSFIKSMHNSSGHQHNVLNLMQVSDAVPLVKKELGVTEGSSLPERSITAEGAPQDANVVVILLESMSHNCLSIESGGKNLMPYFNSLIDRSYYFEHFYSSGVHTNNGIVSTLYGYPALFDRHSMLNAGHYSGLPGNLKQAGYQTLFFVTSNPNYDHMNSFLYENGFERIYSMFDYPEEKAVNNFGVADDYLLEYGLDRLNEASQTGKPFIAAFMTVSHHPPYIVPDAYKDVAGKEEDCIIAFVDHTLETFMTEASKQEWYKNTYFILLGDHGTAIGMQKYGMALSYNHIPCVIHSPLLKDSPRRLSNYGGQIDIFPTVMGLLNRSYTNDSFGIDLLREHRPCMYFVSNNQLGCIDDDNFYVRDLDADMDFLYDIKNEHPDNQAANKPAILNKLRNYSMSMTVVADSIMKHRR
ncbi:MAG: sulfatase-like hydrolase/transferase [Dysgonamonadaceae bacterium]|jgi:phosphoglycerol transferase MdoB-like AlkP superfamily enzyme|nr:sulfatase-like hydrolase/transferase [Dysgonamonadaceae bacterium]